MTRKLGQGLGGCALMIAVACGGGNGADASSGDSGAATAPAVVVAVGVGNPEGWNIYLGAYSDVPSDDLDLRAMLELPYVYVKVFGGYVYTYDAESAKLTRYSVSDDLQLVEGPSLSFAGAGVSYVDLQLRNLHLAYGVSGDLVIEWDPEAMEILRTYDSSLPSLSGLPPTPDSLSLVGGAAFEGAAHWNVYANDFETLTYHDAAAVAFLEPGATEFELIEDTRCAPNGKSYVIDGDLYVVGANTSAQVMKVYNPEYADAAPNCVLRVRAGERRFDPDYFLDLTAATGSPAIFGTWRADDEHLVAQVWDAGDAFPESADDYWSAPSFVTKLVKLDLQTGEAAAFDEVPKGKVANDRELVVDGKAYFQVADGDGSGVTVNELSPSGLEPAFRTKGGVYAFGRVR